MLQNVIDMRNEPGRWRQVRAELRPAGYVADDSPPYALACDIQTVTITQEAISIAEAVGWAGRQLWPVDLYIFDQEG